MGAGAGGHGERDRMELTHWERTLEGLGIGTHDK